MTTSNPLRLDAALVQSARAVAKRNKRTVPRQIEYWADLGRAVEAIVDPAALIALQEGLARLVVEMKPSSPVATAGVFSDLDRARADGSLPGRVSEARVRYQKSLEAPGYLEQVNADGTTIVGHFRGGSFVPGKTP